MGSRKHAAGPSCGLDDFLKDPTSDAEKSLELRITVPVQSSPYKALGAMAGAVWQRAQICE